MVDSIVTPFQYFHDNSGAALSGGYIYIGVAGQNAVTYPKQAYWDAAMTIPAAQPIRTVSGRPAYNGSPANIYVDGDYSMVVRDAGMNLITSVLNSPLRFDSTISASSEYRAVPFETVADMLASTEDARGVGEIWQAGDYRYEEADPGAADHHLTTAGGVKLYVLPLVGSHIPSAWGADTGTSDNSATLDAMEDAASNAGLSVLYDAFYPVTGNFARADIPHYGPGGVTIGGTDIPLNTERSLAAVNVYVDVSGSDTANHGLSATYPFKTLQRAYDSLPANIGHQQTINVADGTHNTSYRAAADMPRPAILYTQGKAVGQRTAQSGSDLIGMVVIKGESEAGTIIETDPSNDYTYGIYATRSEVALQEITIQKGSTGTTSALLTSHRSAYVHLLECTVNATGVALGSVAEAGGRIESINSDHTGASSYDLVAYQDSFVQVANPAQDGRTSGLALASGGVVDVAVGGTLTGNSLAASKGSLTFTGTSGARVTMSGDITADPGCFVGGAYLDFTGNMTARGSDIRLSACGWSKTISVQGGTVRLDGSVSYVSPATQSTVALPLVLRFGADAIIDATTQIKNSSGDFVGPDYGVQSLPVAADSTALSVTLQGRTTVVSLFGNTATRSSCTIGDVAGVYSGTEPPNGAILIFSAAASGAFGVEIVDGSTATIPGGTITVGGGSGQYSSATFAYNRTLGKWMLQSHGLTF